MTTACRCATTAELKGNDATDYADQHLRKISVDHEKWILQYQCRETGARWELCYPHPEYHGGGSPELKRLDQAG